MPVTRPLLSCSPFLSFQSAFRASGQSCAQCPWFLDNLHFVQPEKSCSPLAHSCAVCAASRAALICTTASCISLSLISTPRAARACASCCGCLGRRNSRGRGEFQCIQLGYWVDVCLAVPASPYFHVGNKHTVGQSVLVVQTHTNRLSHFSFSLPANFLHFSFFLPANFLHLLFSFLLTFCTFHFFFLLSTSLSQPSTVCSHS